MKATQKEVKWHKGDILVARNVRDGGNGDFVSACLAFKRTTAAFKRSLWHAEELESTEYQ